MHADTTKIYLFSLQWICRFRFACCSNLILKSLANVRDTRLSQHKIRARMHTWVLQRKLDVVRCTDCSCSGNIPNYALEQQLSTPSLVLMSLEFEQHSAVCDQDIYHGPDSCACFSYGYVFLARFRITSGRIINVRHLVFGRDITFGIKEVSNSQRADIRLAWPGILLNFNFFWYHDTVADVYFDKSIHDLRPVFKDLWHIWNDLWPVCNVTIFLSAG